MDHFGAAPSEWFRGKLMRNWVVREFSPSHQPGANACTDGDNSGGASVVHRAPNAEYVLPVDDWFCNGCAAQNGRFWRGRPRVRGGIRHLWRIYSGRRFSCGLPAASRAVDTASPPCMARPSARQAP
jgi:hypothetical protein